MKNLNLISVGTNVTFLIILFMFSGCTFRTDPGKGKKIGRIVKISQQGLLFKTWEGQLIRGGLNDGSGSMGGSFDFTIENDYLASEALSAFEKQQEVILEYRCEFISLLSRSERINPYFIEKITYP